MLCCLQVIESLVESRPLELQVWSILWSVLRRCTSFICPDPSDVSIIGLFGLLLLCVCIQATEGCLDCSYLTSNSLETPFQPLLLGGICNSMANSSNEQLMYHSECRAFVQP